MWKRIASLVAHNWLWDTAGAVSTTDLTPDEPSGQLDLFERAELLPVTHEVVEAPLEELGASRVPRTLRKANAAVHIYPAQGNYSLPMRRLFNALLALAHAKLRRMPAGTVEQLVMEQKVLRFEASVSDIKALIGWTRSGDNESIYEMLKSMQKLAAVWDVLDTSGERWQEHSTLLSQWGRTEAGKLRWAWMPDLFGLLFDPANPYTPLDLALSRQFNSRYTLALFENAFRFRHIKATPWRKPDEWKLLLAGHDVYKDFREFRRSVLKSALEEIRKTPTCPIELELEEKRGQFNRVEAMRFVIKPKPQTALNLPLPADENPRLLANLLQLGVSEEKARQLLRDYDSMYLERQVEFVDRERAKKPIRNVAGFFIKAVEDRYHDEVAKHEVVVQEKIEREQRQAQRAELETGWKQFRRGEVELWWGSRSEETRAPLREEFLAQATATVTRCFSKGGWKNKVVNVAFFEWLGRKEGVLTSPEALDFANYVSWATTRR